MSTSLRITLQNKFLDFLNVEVSARTISSKIAQVRPPGPVPVSGPGLRLGPNDTTPDRGFSGGPTNGTTPDRGFWEQGTNGTTPDRGFLGGPTNDTAPDRFWRPVSYFLIKKFPTF